jgi:hypothetical protein
LKTVNLLDETIYGYLDRDDTFVYGYYSPAGEYFGDYRARLSGNGLVDVFEWHPKNSYINTSLHYVKQAKADVPVWKEKKVTTTTTSSSSSSSSSSSGESAGTSTGGITTTVVTTTTETATGTLSGESGSSGSTTVVTTD